MRAWIPILTLVFSSAALPEDKADLAVVHKIRDQAFNHSEIEGRGGTPTAQQNR